MSRVIFFGAGALVLAAAIVGWRITESFSLEILPESNARPPQAAPMCPWRDPQSDLKQFFPSATRYEVDTRILSGLRVELAQRLGRTPTGEENALHVYRIYQDKLELGTVLTRRVKGDYGAIELVLAVEPAGQVRGLRLQRLREPDSIAAALKNPEWLHSFEGRNADSSWKIGGDIAEVPSEARQSANAIVEGTRSLLILLAAASLTNAPGPATPSHH
jgi:hypothetical protein